MTHRPRRTWQIVVAVVLCLLGTAAWSSGQGLAEAARKEEARRKAIKKPAKVYSNGSLTSIPGEVIPTPPSPRTDAGDTAPEASGGAAAPAPVEAPAVDARRTPEYWRDRMAEAVQARDNNRLMLDALQSRINGLWADFTARDNPLERSAIAADRQKALDELDRRKKTQVALEKAVSDVEDEARRANIPPGWLR